MADLKSHSRVWAELKIDGRAVSQGALLLLLALAEYQELQCADLDNLQRGYRYWLASNLTEQEFQRAGWAKRDAWATFKRALSELVSLELVARFEEHGCYAIGRGFAVADQARSRFVEEMAFEEFNVYCRNTYTRVTGRIE